MTAVLRLTVREGLGGWFLPLLLLAGALLTLLLPELVLFGFGDETRIVRELGHANVRIAALLCVLYLGPGLIGRDREGLLATVLARPLHAARVVLGRYLGALLVTELLLLGLSAAMAVALKGGGPSAAELARVGALGASLLALATLLATVLRPGPAAVVLVVAFALGHLHSYLTALLVPAGEAAAAILAVLLPDLESIGVPLSGPPATAAAGLGTALARAALLSAGLLMLAAGWAELREVGPGRAEAA
ncbi:MAG: hypothetical protein KatS3mg102_1616 [Planctomycetota bacterium]|nr:MAG: hypothetical protein KatS3mg102_1616 [Planctomycetota bacterium]